MFHERSRNLNRRAVLALLPWLPLAAAGAGCSPAGQASSETAEIPDRLKKMRALRGTGDPRLKRKPSSGLPRRVSKPG
jgi:hypothetical protein